MIIDVRKKDLQIHCEVEGIKSSKVLKLLDEDYPMYLNEKGLVHSQEVVDNYFKTKQYKRHD